MKHIKIVAVGLGLLFATGTALAKNKPCSGKKRGVDHCSGTKYVCRDGTISQSKKACSR